MTDKRDTEGQRASERASCHKSNPSDQPICLFRVSADRRSHDRYADFRSL